MAIKALGHCSALTEHKVDFGRWEVIKNSSRAVKKGFGQGEGKEVLQWTPEDSTAWRLFNAPKHTVQQAQCLL